MKRIAMLLVIVLLAITNVFATTAALPANQTKAKTEVSFTLKEEDVTEYRFGFVSSGDLAKNSTWQTADSRNNMKDIPTKAEKMNISYSRADQAAISKDYSIFYKVRGASSINISLKATTPLQCTGKGDIDYTVAVSGKGTGKVDTAVKSSVWTSDTIKLDSFGTANGIIPIEIKTSTAINATMIGTYTSALTLEITPV